MNTSLSAAERMRLLPRLRILQHATRLLCEQLSQEAATALPALTGEHAIDWSNWERFPLSQPSLEVRSEQALALPTQAGVCARLLGAPLSGISPATRYQLPDVSLTFSSPSGAENLTLTISPGHFHTFAQGVPERHLLEYMATLLDLELLPLGFRCLRQTQRLSIEALPERAGWNISVTRLGHPPSAHAQTDAGLHPGLSSRDPDQQTGIPARLHWGPYLINGQRCAVALPFENNATHFTTLFLEELQSQLEPVGCTASWTSAGELLLHPPDTRPELVIEPLPREALPFPDLLLALPLPTGLHRPQIQAVHELGEICVNGFEWTLQAPADLSPSAQPDWLLKALSPIQANIQASYSASGALCLTTQSAGQPVILEYISPALGSWLGLHPTRLQAPSQWQALWIRWEQLRQQVLEALPVPLLATLRHAPPLAAETHPDQGERLIWLQACLAELETLSSDLSPPPASVSPVSLPASTVLREPPITAAVSQRLHPGEKPVSSENEPPHSRFDHKI